MNDTKYLLLKNEYNLNEEQNIKLMDVKKQFLHLAEMHKLKEKPRQIFENKK
ncbi:transposase [Microcoleus sp.]|uniref:transposase n=1 Tax=Microcoleus sp. TaxID=44472 RepID=UPI003C744910